MRSRIDEVTGEPNSFLQQGSKTVSLQYENPRWRKYSPYDKLIFIMAKKTVRIFVLTTIILLAGFFYLTYNMSEPASLNIDIPEDNIIYSSEKTIPGFGLILLLKKSILYYYKSDSLSPQ